MDKDKKNYQNSRKLFLFGNLKFYNILLDGEDVSPTK